MKAMVSALLSLSFVVFISGCVSGQSLAARYQPAGQILAAPKVERLLVFMPTESGPDERKDQTAIGFLTLIPGFPFATQTLTPENGFYAAGGIVPASGSPRYEYDFKKDLGELIVSDLKAAGIARNVCLVGDDSEVDGKSEVVFLSVKLNQALWSRTLTTYGSSVMGSVWWMLGAPPSYGYVDIGLQVSLLGTDGVIKNTVTLSSRAGMIESFYVNKLPLSLNAAYREISPQLRRFVMDHLPTGSSARTTTGHSIAHKDP